MKAVVSVLVWVLAACGPGVKDVNKVELANPKFDEFVDQLTTASTSGDVATLRKFLGTSVVNGGIAFEDIECLKQFSAMGDVAAAKLDAFAKCLATLKLERSERKDELPDVAALQYGGGLELEARIVETTDGPRLTWIGFVARRDMQDALPTITARALEQLRVEGEPHGPIADPAVFAPDVALGGSAFAWLKVCIDGTGQVTGTRIRDATSLRTARAFAAVVPQWRFKPFLLRGQPSPVCSMVQLVYPADKAKPDSVLPLPVPSGPEGMFRLRSRALGKRIAGNAMIAPRDNLKRWISSTGVKQVIAAFQYCIDVSGKVFHVDMIRSSGIAGYDKQLVDGIKTWQYKPYLDEGKPVPVCSSIVFKYSQTWR